jgi:lysophospholipase L1-like esterase
MKINLKNLKPLDYVTIISAMGALFVVGYWIKPKKLLSQITTKKIDPKGKTFAFMGDSYTSLPTYGWQSVLAKNYDFKEINIAKGGMQTSWMVRQTENYLSKNKPDYYVIMGGANDAYSPQTIETAIKNIQKMIDMANAKGVKPIVITGYNARKVQVGNTRQKPTSEQLRRGVTQDVLWGMGEKYYKMQLRMLSDLKNATIVPIWDDAKQSDTYDGLHMTWDAHKKFANHVGNYLFKKKD